MGKDDDGSVFEYAAFVSYRHAPLDKKWAKWLVDQLETYEIPKHLQQRGLPKKIGKVYRDEDEAHAGALLGDHIADALRKSRSVVVVCTENTQDSPWIEQELEYFRQLGRSKQIFLLLAEGEPEDAFPRSMLDRVSSSDVPLGAELGSNIIAADVRGQSYTKQSESTHVAKLRLISGIIGCGFDELKQRDKERRRRAKRLMTGSMAIVSIFALGFAGWLWDQSRIKTAYFSSATSVWGEPIGAISLTEEEFLASGMAFQIDTRGGKTVSVHRRGFEIAFAYSMPVFGAQEIYRWDVVYEADGDVERLLTYDRHGQLVGVHDYEISRSDQTAFIDFRSPNGVALLSSDEDRWLSPDNSNDSRTQISRHFIRFDEAGRMETRMYRDQYSVPRRDQTGQFGHRFTYDSNGLETERRAVGPDEKPLASDLLPSIIRTIRESDGYITARQTFSANMEPVLNPRGYSEVRYENDNLGNLIGYSFWGTQSEPVHHRNWTHSAVLKRDAYGNVIERRFFGTLGNPVGLNGEHHRWIGRYDDQQNLIWSQFFVFPEAPNAHKRVFHIYRAQYDDLGRRIEASYYDMNDRPVLGNSSAHIIRFTYDDTGNIVEKRFFDRLGNLRIENENGLVHAIERRSYDSNGFNTEIAFFDARNDPIHGPYGFHRFIREADPVRGLFASARYFDESGAPANKSDGSIYTGFHRYDVAYDDRGNLISEAFFSENGEAFTLAAGFHESRKEFDHFGRRILVRYLGPDGEPASRDGYHQWRAEYDEKSNRTSVAYFGVSGEPVLHLRHGYHRQVSTFDEFGGLVTRTYYEIDGSISYVDSFN